MNAGLSSQVPAGMCSGEPFENYANALCSLSSTGGVFAGYYASATPYGFVDPAQNYLYLAVTNHLTAGGTPQATGIYPSYGYIGMLCINVGVSMPILCPKSWYQLGTDLLYMSEIGGSGIWLGAGKGFSAFAHGKGIYMKALKRYFAIDAVNWKLHCFDLNTKANCSSFPYKLNGSAPLYSTDSLNDPVMKNDIIVLDATRFYIMTDLYLYCFIGTTMAPCGPGWPIKEYSVTIAGRVGQELAFTLPAVAYENPIGSFQGVCNYVGCFDFSGRLRDDWGFSANLRAKFPLTTDANNYYGHYGAFATTMGRSLFFYPLGYSTTCYCFDHLTNQSCSGFSFGFASSYPYSVEPHPYNARCMLYTTDLGSMGAFDVFNGGSCATASITRETDLTEKGSLTCSGKPPVSRRLSFEALSINNGTVVGMTLTVLSSTGVAVANWTNLTLTVGAPIDLTSLSTTLTGPTAQYMINFVSPTTGTPTVPYRLTYYGPGPEVCLTVLPTVNQTTQIPVVAETINKGANTTITSYNTTINAQPC